MVPTFIQVLPKLIINFNFYKLQEVFVEELVILFLVFVEELMILFPIILCMDGDKVNRIQWMRMQAWKVRMLRHYSNYAAVKPITWLFRNQSNRGNNLNILRVDTLYLASHVCSCFFVQLLFIYGIILDVYLIGASGSNIEYTLNNVG